MRRNSGFLFVSACLLTVSFAQDSAQSGSASQSPTATSGSQAQTGTTAQGSAAANQGNSQVQAGGIVYAELSKSVDAKKAKQGDEVVAKTSQAVLSQGKVVVPKGAKLIGRVTQAKAHTKEQPQSELGIAFDHAVLKDGTQIPMALTIQAIGASSGGATASSGVDADAAGMAAPGGAGGRPGYGSSGASSGTMGAARSSVGTVANTAGNATGTVGDTAGGVAGSAGQTTGTRLGAGSHGVVGLSGLSMSSPASASQGAVISSENKNVKLDSGTELVLKVSQ
jgi:hypothetical protein